MYQTQEPSGGFLVFQLLLLVVTVVSLWKVFQKAGQPGWASIIPIYNIIVLLKIVDKPLWWIILLLIPFVNIVMAFVIYIELAKKFGQGAGFGIGLVLLGIIFFPILAFGNYTYEGVVAQDNDLLDN
ncbi:hypothetical protein SAMN05216474_1867 [Lishizhenia tianjinensis]|uniref:Signal peptidase I n=1 Tax=Lishizhenia tianjinensis TaxID=477690 RepID=A0A1I7A3L8_9FLAO|nr:DUF5684 domain-containing protein [Lishizhenia tianjinensis]SFT69513.1 hypothetical protein SAMN05216474_1867 [Lishizhenia tianjinensis]